MAQLALLGVALTVAAVTSGSIVQSPLNGKDFELLILHNNDMHARFEQTSQLSGACTTADREAGKCYGGFPRVAHVVKEARRAAATGQGPPVLYLNAGDTYTGTAWFTIYKWKIAAEFVNALQPDAVSLGNNEFENGAEQLSPFLSNIDTKILAANVILKSAEGNKKFQKSAIFDIQGVKVGVVGYLTPEAKNLDESDNVEYINEVIALKEEVNKLQEQNINIIIALGHSTAEKTVEIAQEVDGLDLVISGHKNTFFWNGSTVNDEDEVLTVTQNSGKRVPIIQSAAYDKFLGKLVATFSTDGEITNYNVEHVILDESIPQNQEALKISTKSNDEVTLRANTPVGNTAVVLDGDSCKTEECNLGNLIADAMVYNYALSYEGEIWTDTAIAFIHADAIAASIAPPNRPATVTYGDLWGALPLESNVVIVTMNGTILNNVLEHSVSNYNLTTPSTQFLQFSGIRVVYDMSQPPGSRVVSAVVRCWSCYVPEFYIIDDWRTYNVLMPVALAEGQFGYSMLAGLTVQSTLLDEVTSTAKFIAMRSPVYPEVAGRIVLRNVAPLEESEEEEEDTGEIEETTTEAVVTEEVTTDAPDSATRLTCTLLFVVLLSFILS